MHGSEASEQHERRTVKCAKCSHENSAGRNTCRRCGARTYISCHHCGHSNERIAALCRQCGRRLHRPLFKRLHKRLFSGHARITPLQIVLLIVFVLIAYKAVVYLAEYRPPTASDF